MASINLYRIDPAKVQLCLQDIATSRLEHRKTKIIERVCG